MPMQYPSNLRVIDVPRTGKIEMESFSRSSSPLCVHHHRSTTRTGD